MHTSQQLSLWAALLFGILLIAADSFSAPTLVNAGLPGAVREIAGSDPSTRYDAICGENRELWSPVVSGGQMTHWMIDPAWSPVVGFLGIAERRYISIQNGSIHGRLRDYRLNDDWQYSLPGGNPESVFVGRSSNKVFAQSWQTGALPLLEDTTGSELWSVPATSLGLTAYNSGVCIGDSRIAISSLRFSTPGDVVSSEATLLDTSTTSTAVLATRAFEALVFAQTFSANESHLLIASNGDGEQAVQMLSATDLTDVWAPPETFPGLGPSAVRFTPSGKVAIIYGTANLVIYDPVTDDRWSESIYSQGAVSCIAFGDDGNSAYVGTTAGEVFKFSPIP